MAFQDVIKSLKDYLKGQLTAENTEIITHIDSELDKVVAVHSETEKELDGVKNKLIDVVKNTSFKTDEKSNNDIGDDDSKQLSVDEAFDEAVKQLEQARKGGK